MFSLAPVLILLFNFHFLPIKNDFLTFAMNSLQ